MKEMNALVAVDERGGIGKDNRLRFSIADDMKYFRQMTLDSVVVLGRRNLESFPGGKPLPRRRNIVLSETLEPGEGYEVVRDLPALFALLKEEEQPVFVIGGGQVYRQLLPWCRKAYVTKMYRDFGGDVFFPDLDEDPDWLLVEAGEEREYEGLAYRFTVYENSWPEEVDNDGQ